MQKLIDAYLECPIWAQLGLIIFSPIIVPMLIIGWIMCSMFAFVEKLR
jgi:hypothetical protein